MTARWRLPACFPGGSGIKFSSLSDFFTQLSTQPFRLRNLDLHSMNLTGPIGPIHVWLPALITLDLSYNSLSGGLPPDLGSYPQKQLAELNLAHNSLRGKMIRGEGGRVLVGGKAIGGRGGGGEVGN